MIVRFNPGLGITGSQEIGVIGGSVATVGGTIFSSAAILHLLGIGASAGPIGIAVAGLVAAGAAIASAMGVGSGCGQNCINATKVVNDAEPILRQNVAAYEGGQIDQATAESNYQQVWGAVVKACSGIPGEAGSNCVSDRQEGSCKYKQVAAPKYPGEPEMGECWNWYEAYYGPLTHPAMTAFSGTNNDISLTSITSSPWLLVGVGAIALYAATR